MSRDVEEALAFYSNPANLPTPPVEEDAKTTRRRECCGIRYEHGAFTQAQPCHDCPEVLR